MGSKDQSSIRKLFFIFLLALPLLYAAFFRSHSLVSWKSKSITNNAIEEEADPIDFLVRRLVRGKDRKELDGTGFSCDSSLYSDVCVSNKPVRIDTRSLTVYLSPDQTLPPMNRTIQPYPRKYESTTMSTVTKVVILRGDINDKPPPECDVTHDVSAVIFSTSGFVGNLFHEFNEIIIPLFLTTHHFKSHLQFIVTDFKDWWVSKYNRILTNLSHYDVMNPAEDGKVHCFPGAVLGLKFHDQLACNETDIPGGYSMTDFRRFIRDSYSLKIKNVAEIEKPVLVLVSRQTTRVFINEYEIIGLARELGFQVITATPNQTTNLDKFSGEINSCSVLLGVHGAGLTNVVFMPEGAVLLQVVPLGLEWPSTVYYGQTVVQMNVHYLEYRINPEESSLLEKYGPNHPVITDPASIRRQGYFAERAVYIDGQNLKLDLSRFRETLLQALQLIGRSGSGP